MSSYLSKSKKDFKPKAPARRPGAGIGGVSSSQSSIRGSAERQTQTPQPQSASVNDGIAVPLQLSRISASPVAQPLHDKRQKAGPIPSLSETQRHVSPPPQSAQEHNSTSSPPSQPERRLLRNFTDRQRLNVPLKELEPTNSSHLHSTTARTHRDPPQSRTQPLTTFSEPDTTPHLVHNGDEDILQPPSKRQKTALPVLARVSASPPARPISVSADATITAVPPGHGITYTAPASKVSTRTANIISQGAVATAVNQETSSIESPTVAAEDAALLAQNDSVSAIGRTGGKLAKKQKQRKKRETKQQRLERLADEVAAAATGRNEQAGIAENPRLRKSGKKGKRAMTPENAESMEISQNIITMSELTRDIRLGKISSRETRLRERDAEELNKKQERAQEQARQQAEQSLDNEVSVEVNVANSMAATAVSAGTGRTSGAASFPTAPPTTLRIAPQVRLVNGQIVQDEESRMIDRHGAAAALRVSEDDVRVEDELTRKINAGAYMKRETHMKWTMDATELFYDGLRMFGTDFMTISKMFPGRSRRQIKLKFNKEERTAREKVQRALLLERKPANLQELEALAGEAYPDPALLEKNMREDRLRLEEEQRKEVEAMDELVKQRERDAAAESGTVESGERADGDGSSAKENEDVSRTEGATEEENSELEGNGRSSRNDRSRGRRSTRNADGQSSKKNGGKFSRQLAEPRKQNSRILRSNRSHASVDVTSQARESNVLTMKN